MPDLRKERPDAPDDLVRLIDKSSRKRPGDRFSDCSQIVALLDSSKAVAESCVQGLTIAYSPRFESEVNAILNTTLERLKTVPGLRIGHSRIGKAETELPVQSDPLLKALPDEL